MGDVKLPDTGKLEIEMKDFKGILETAIANSVGSEIEELKKQMTDVQQKALFKDDGDGTGQETFAGSIIDSGYFQKDYMQRRGYGGNLFTSSIVSKFKSSSGPFVKLSPAMEKFAIILKHRGNIADIQSKGIFDTKEYRAELEEQYEKQFGINIKALTETDAGALVPVEYLATVIEFATAQSPILSKVWRIPMGSLSMKIPKLVQAAGSYFGGIQLYHPDEGGIKTDTKPSFDTLTLTAKKLIGLMHLTDELIADSSIAIVNYCTTLMVRAIRWQTEKEVIYGTGAGNQMLGIRNDPGINLVTRATPGTIKYTDLIDLESSLDENFQDLTFLSRRLNVNALRKQVDTNGQPVYHDGFTTFLGAQMVAQLMGYPLIRTRNCLALGAKGDIILGDLGFYLWGVRSDMTIDTSNAPRYIYDETTIRIVMRQDGLPGVSEAFSVLDGTAS